MAFKDSRGSFYDSNSRFADKRKKDVNVSSDYCYNIQSDILSEKKNDARFERNDRVARVQMASNAAKKRKKLFSEKPGKTTEGFKTEATEYPFDIKGSPKADSSAETGVALPAAEAFLNKMAEFTEKSAVIFEDVYLPDEEDEEDAISKVDDKTGILLDYSALKDRRQAKQYKQIEKEAKKELKELKKEVDYGARFNESQARFSDPESKFSDPISKMFRKDQMDYRGEPIFATPAIRNVHNYAAVGLSKTSIAQPEPHAAVVQESGGNHSAAEESVYERFQETSPKANRSVDSYFSDAEGVSTEKTSSGPAGDETNTSSSVSNRFMSKEERTEQAEAKRKEAKSHKNKKMRKAASKTAFANVLKTKKNMQNEVSDMSREVSGDLIADGTGNILQTASGNAHTLLQRGAEKLAEGTVKAIGYAAVGIANGIKSTAAAAAPLLLALIVPIIILLCCTATDNGNVTEFDDYDLEIEGDGLTYYSLSGEEIDDIIALLYATYNIPELDIYNMSYTQEMVLRYGLSKVGCEYNQNYHGSLTRDIFDCSSLAFRAYRSVGIDISSADIYSAAEECRAMELGDKAVPPGEELLPGDLIFYGGAVNERYKGVYHVGIYVGIGKMVEAKGRRWGVVYGDVRTDNVVCIARPYR